MGIFGKGSDESIAAAGRLERAEAADALREKAIEQLALGNTSTAYALNDQARALEGER